MHLPYVHDHDSPERIVNAHIRQGTRYEGQWEMRPAGLKHEVLLTELEVQ